MASQVDRITLGKGIEVELQDGSIMRLRPGHYGKGVSIAQIKDATKPIGGGKRGRKPRPTTEKLRNKLAKDHRNGKLAAAPQYVKWYLSRDKNVGLTTARQIVYRERRAVLE